MSEYDFLIVGAGIFGCTVAWKLIDAGYRCIVIDKREHVGGNCYTKIVDGIPVHVYGPHIFHTHDKNIWDFVCKNVEITPTPDFSPIAVSQGQVFNLPFNMNTFAQLFGTITPQAAKAKIAADVANTNAKPSNLKEQAISLVGETIYHRLIEGYTQKQWGRPCEDLPPEIIKRLPIRFTYDNSYYNDPYVGIAEDGWTPLFRKLLIGAEIYLGVDYITDKAKLQEKAKRVIYTGEIDRYFNYCLGRLEYRSLRFETEVAEGDRQGTAVINWEDAEIPYTRSIEHKHFVRKHRNNPNTIVTYEYPAVFENGSEPFYPINDAKNNQLHNRYMAIAMKEKNVYFAGRLGLYRYYDMDDAIIEALKLCDKIIKDDKQHGI